MKNTLIVAESSTMPAIDVSEDSRLYKLAGLLVVMGLLGGGLTWASLATLSGAIVVQGKLTVES
ncbi:MAG: hypothetical protein ACR2RE_27450, partial [Geminicoccaceae bacterium]